MLACPDIRSSIHDFDTLQQPPCSYKIAKESKTRNLFDPSTLVGYEGPALLSDFVAGAAEPSQPMLSSLSSWGNGNSSHVKYDLKSRYTPLDTPTTFDFNLLDFSNDFSGEVARPRQLNQEITSCLPYHGERILPYSNSATQDLHTSISSSSTHTFSHNSTSPCEEAVPIHFGHYPSRAAALSMDAALYEIDYRFGTQDSGLHSDVPRGLSALEV